MKVSFLNRTEKQGAKKVVGPVTGLIYHILPTGTSVSALNADALLSMTEPPCCGESLPFGGEVRSFGNHRPTFDQVQAVPDHIWNARAVAKPEKKSGRRKKLHTEYDKPEEEAPLEVSVEDNPLEEIKEE